MSKAQLPKQAQTGHRPLKVGRMHFSKETERKLFFFLTLALLVMGLLGKMGIW